MAAPECREDCEGGEQGHLDTARGDGLGHLLLERLEMVRGLGAVHRGEEPPDCRNETLRIAGRAEVQRAGEDGVGLEVVRVCGGKKVRGCPT
jgi:hypothetical protein